MTDFGLERSRLGMFVNGKRIGVADGIGSVGVFPLGRAPSVRMTRIGGLGFPSILVTGSALLGASHRLNGQPGARSHTVKSSMKLCSLKTAPQKT